MNFMKCWRIATVLGATLSINVGPIFAQPLVTSQATPIAPPAEKPMLVVTAFESGTVSAQVQGARSGGIFGSRHGGSGEKYNPSELGTGIADMLIEKLLESGQFRLLERKPIESATGAQYIVSGSVTKFGFEEHNAGGLLATTATMGLVSYKQHKTEVALTARVSNAATGGIVASMDAEGASKKGGGLRVGGIGGNTRGGARLNNAKFRATAIGEATERSGSNPAGK